MSNASPSDDFHARLIRESQEARAGADCPNPYCRARKGEPCRNPGESPSLTTVHLSRRMAFEGKTPRLHPSDCHDLAAWSYSQGRDKTR